MVERLKGFIEGVDERQERIVEGLRQILNSHRQRLKDNAFFLQTQTLGLIKSHHQRLASITEGLKRAPALRIKESRKSLIDYQEHLKKIIYLHLQNSRTKINNYEKLTQMASPESTLKRGFSITRSQDGQLIRCVKDVKEVKGITTQLVDGIINSEVRY